MRVIVIAPAASGKTEVVARIARSLRAYGYRVEIIDDPAAQELSDDGPLDQMGPMDLEVRQAMSEGEAAAMLRALPPLTRRNAHLADGRSE